METPNTTRQLYKVISAYRRETLSLMGSHHSETLSVLKDIRDQETHRKRSSLEAIAKDRAVELRITIAIYAAVLLGCGVWAYLNDKEPAKPVKTITVPQRSLSRA